LHRHGLLPSIFQPDEATQTLRDLVRQRANHVRLSGQHIQRMQKALELMNLKLTKVLGDITGVTGLKILRAIVAGEGDPVVLVKLRDRRYRHTAEEIATLNPRTEEANPIPRRAPPSAVRAPITAGGTLPIWLLAHPQGSSWGGVPSIRALNSAR
jgi:hypothetical protein